MERMAESGPNDKAVVTLWVIWGAMLVSLLIYVFIGSQVPEEMRQKLGGALPLDLIRKILLGVAAFTLIVAIFIRKRIVEGGSAGYDMKSSMALDPSTSPSALGKYMTAMIISLGLCESVGVYGLILFFLGDSFQTLLIFIGIGALGMVFFRPKREEFETLALAVQRTVR